jgi:hypothetical protein
VSALVVVGLGVLIVVGVLLLRRSNVERREVVENYVGKTLTLVTLQGKTMTSGVTGRIQQVDEHHVVLVSKSGPQVVPIAAIQEIWRGRRRLGRW